MGFISLETHSAAPVVDEQENFALLNDEPINESNNSIDEERALAHDTMTSSNNFENNAQILNEIKGLQQSIDELRGQLDIQAKSLQNLREQQLAFYKDLDARVNKNTPDSTPTSPLSNTEAAVTSARKEVTLPTQSSSHKTHNPADEQISYLAAYDLVKNKQFDSALASMQTFVINYPDGGYTANAHYWLGELYIIKKNYKEAIKEFDTVLTKFPASSKTAASSLKIGYALAASGQKNEARQRLEMVIKTYPNTPTAQLAQAKLDNLNLL